MEFLYFYTVKLRRDKISFENKFPSHLASTKAKCVTGYKEKEGAKPPEWRNRVCLEFKHF